MVERILEAPSDRGAVENDNERHGYLTRRAIDEVERLFGWLHKWQRIEPSGQPVKLNLGSGLHVAPGWINVDGSVKTLFARLPQFALRWAHTLTNVRDTHSHNEFVTLLLSNETSMPPPSGSHSFTIGESPWPAMKPDLQTQSSNRLCGSTSPFECWNATCLEKFFDIVTAEALYPTDAIAW